MPSAIDLVEAPVQAPAAEPAAPTLPPQAITREPSHRRRRLWLLVVLVFIVGAIALGRNWPTFFPPAPVDTLTASGRIEGREISLAPKEIQARVARLLVDEGEVVTKGQVVAELDAAQLEARRASLAGTLASVDAQITQATLDVAYTAKTSAAGIEAARAAVSSAEARAASAQAVAANADIEYRRALTLVSQGVIAPRDRDQAETLWHTSQADVDAAQKEAARAEANLTLAIASADTIRLKQQQLRALQENRRAIVGQIAESEADLAERQIIAPTNGTILSRTVEVGDVVSPGTPVFQIVDMNRLYVKVYIPEPDIGKLRLGARADVTIDAFPGRRFPAHVSKIHDQAEFTPKNVETAEERLKLVFGVELALDNPDAVLKPGMPAECILHVAAGDRTNGSR